MPVRISSLLCMRTFSDVSVLFSPLFVFIVAITDSAETFAQNEAMVRERQCGMEWKNAKASGTVPAGMTWPEFWKECDLRLKGQELDPKLPAPSERGKPCQRYPNLC